MRGQFSFKENGVWRRVPNIIPNDGEKSYLEILFQGNDTIVPLNTGNYYIGLMADESVSDETTLETITEIAEPDYARIPLGRNATDFPTVSNVGGDWYAESKTITFTADADGWSTGFRRAFMCNVASGTVGVLLAISGSYATPKVLGPSEAFPMRYAIFLD